MWPPSRAINGENASGEGRSLIQFYIASLARMLLSFGQKCDFDLGPAAHQNGLFVAYIVLFSNVRLFEQCRPSMKTLTLDRHGNL